MIYDSAHVEPTPDGRIQVTFFGPEGVRSFTMTPENATHFADTLREAAKHGYK